jgi:uncharacterized membrane protein
MSTRRYRLLNALLLLALFAGSAWAYPRLPARIPVHFGLSGEPDRWAARSVASWFLLPAIAAALALALHGMSVAGARNPDLWNLPDKRRFKALRPAQQAPIIARMQEFLAFVGCVTTALLGVVQAAIFTASTGDATRLPAWALAGMGASVLVIGIAGARMNGEVARMVREAKGPAAD